MGDGMGDAIIEMNVEHSTSNIELYVGNKSNLKLFLARITRVSLFFVLPLSPGFRIAKAHNPPEVDAILVVSEDPTPFNSSGHNVLEEAGSLPAIALAQARRGGGASSLGWRGIYALTEFSESTEKYMIVQRP